VNYNETEKECIIWVDDIDTCIFGQKILGEKYEVVTAHSAEKMFSLLENNNPDMILLDIDIPEMNEREVIKILKSKQKTKNIPVVFISCHTGLSDIFEGLSLGAVDYITKPYNPQFLLNRLEEQLIKSQGK